MSLTSLQVCMDMDSASDQHHQWLQATMHEDGLMDSSSSPSGADMLGPSKILMSESRLRPPQDQALKCPRCDSTHTKFCYYNNYSLSQPRYFCKTCRRYWTKGGTLRNIPVGGGFRKNRKPSSSKKLSSNDQPLSISSINNQNPNPTRMRMMSLPNPVDLQLSFPFLQQPNMMISSGNNIIGGGDYTESMLFNKSIPMHESSYNNDGLTRPTDLCMDHDKQQVVEAVAINNMTSKSNTYGGYFSTQFFGGGHEMHNLCYPDNPHDLGISSYMDDSNNNSYYYAAQDQLAEHSGLHEHHHHNIIQMHREVKPNPKMLLALEWQQEAAGSPDANRSSKQKPFGYDLLGSWSGMSSSAGNIATNHNSLH